MVNFNYQEGGRPVSLEEVLGSFLDGNGAPKTSPHSVSRCGGLLLVCTLGGLEQLRRRPPPAAETGSRSRGSGRRDGDRPRGASRCGHRNPYSARRPLRRAKRLLRSYAGVCLQGLVIALACIIFQRSLPVRRRSMRGAVPSRRCGRMSVQPSGAGRGSQGLRQDREGDYGAVRVLLFVGFLWYNCVTRRWLVCPRSFPSVI